MLIIFILLIGLFIIILSAYCIESLRFRWLSFEELTDEDQARLINEANKFEYQIGNYRVSPDPRIMMYYTKMKRRKL